MGNEACCAAKASELDKEATTGASALLSADAVQISSDTSKLGASPRPVQLVGDIPNVSQQGSFSVRLEKGGDKLGLDVDYLAERRVLPILAVTGGLAEAWNKIAPAASRLGRGDSIVEVNGLRGNATSMLEACKNDAILNLVVAKALSHDNLVEDIERLIKAKKCGPILIRLSWHDAGVFIRGKGGCPNAAMRFTDAGEGCWGANVGLPTVALRLLGNISKKYVPDLISHADLWALAANIAIRLLGGPTIQTRFGRQDAVSSAEGVSSNVGRLPDGDKGAAHLRAVLGPKGLDDSEIVALSGAHTVGQCHIERSGFDGHWTEHPEKFDNAYFRELLGKTYSPETTKAGKPQHRHPGSGTIMLPSDIALMEDSAFRRHVERYAADQSSFFRDFTNAWVKLQENGVEDMLRDVL
mmetsp:Transcript_72254/g.209185  ORF Transcript_72254/g.209185 Transcript_72254/m.209185 type:complete len:412 (-) Transcript_72254:189-1424(-)